MIKEKFIIINGHSSNYKYYVNLGYDVKVRKPFEVKTKDLMKGSVAKITSICDSCESENKNIFKDYWLYTNGLKDPYYCNKCKSIKSEKTSLKNWGFKNPMQSKIIKEKVKKSCINRYGVTHYSKTNEFKLKYKKTSLSKYGVDNIFKTPKMRESSKRWMSSDNFKEKSKASNLGKYGVEYVGHSSEIKDKIRNTILSRYGVDNISRLEDTKLKVINTNMIKYGGHPMLTDDFKNNVKNTKQRNTYKRYVEMISSKYDFTSYKNETFKLTHKDCGSEFEIKRGLLYIRHKLNKMICTKCNPIGVNFSNLEKEVCDYIDTLGIHYEKNNRTILGGKELDIFIPSLNIAFEVNGIFWHSEAFKSSNYHYNKTISCRKKSIDLIHIWEDDWLNKKPIMKSIIAYKLNVTSNRVYGRKCEIKEVNTKEYKKFLNDNHIQGYASSSVNIGLYYENELVSLMTFGYRRTNNKKEYELIRFCNKINISVIGAASKLFKYFKKTYEYNQIISYADVSMFNGNLYKKLGFKNEGNSGVNYYWVGNDNIRRHRYNYSKRKLVKLGYDPSKTETEIMHERGFYRIFSTGQDRWVY